MSEVEEAPTPSTSKRPAGKDKEANIIAAFEQVQSICLPFFQALIFDQGYLILVLKFGLVFSA